MSIINIVSHVGVSLKKYSNTTLWGIKYMGIRH